MSQSTTWTVDMSNLSGNNYNFYIWGMTSAAAEATISILDPNGNTWTKSTAGMTKGEAFNLPNPLGGSNPFGWTIPSTTKPYVFEITISSTATGSNEGIQLIDASNSANSVMAVVLYNDPNSSDTDYNDVVLNLAFYPNEPYGA